MAAPKLQRPEERALLVELYNNGTKLADMAERLGVNTSTVADHVQRLGLPCRGRPTPIPEHAEAQLRALAKEGVSRDVAARSLGLTVYQVRRLLLHFRIEGFAVTWRTHGAIKDPILRTEFVAQKYAEGWSYRRLEEHYGCSSKAIKTATRAVERLVRQGELVLPKPKGDTVVTLGGIEEQKTEAIRRMWMAGNTRVEMTASLKMGYNTILRYVVKLGLPTRRQRRRGKAPFKKQDLVTLVKNGYSREKVARTLGVAVSTVQKWEKVWRITRSRSRLRAILPDELLGDFYQKLFVENTPVKEVAEYFGCNPSTVRRVKKKAQALLDKGVKPGTRVVC
jgi:transposase